MAGKDLELIPGQKTVTTAGTREPLSTGMPENIKVIALQIRAHKTNTGNIYVGDVGVSNTNSYIMAAGENIDLALNIEEIDRGIRINLSQIYLDSAVNGEGVSFLALRSI
jgi:hypothetical protein